jgi:hypothetical protein
MGMQVFGDRFLGTIETVVTQHDVAYPSIAPQGVFFESLALRALHLAGLPDAHIAQTTANAPTHDLIVGKERIPIKTETGKGTKPRLINITKLCTTEREPWEAETLISRTNAHLSRYDRILMLRALWHPDLIHYQLVDIPVNLLRLIRHAELETVGSRQNRRSLGADITLAGEVLFHVHYDGSDGKCQIRNLLVSKCHMLKEWDQRL